MEHRDLTEGSVAKNLLLFAVPFLIANILQSLYGAVDLFVNPGDPDCYQPDDGADSRRNDFDWPANGLQGL